jgi:hypothetical protein
MFSSIGECSVENQAHNRLSADISNTDANTGRIESHKLNRTGFDGPDIAFAAYAAG